MLNPAKDSNVVTIDASGVLHTRTIASLGSGITSTCTTIGQVPVVNSLTGNLGCGIITDNGTNVGIGTTSPTAKLHVLNGLPSSGASLLLERKDVPATTQNNALQVSITSNALTSSALAAGSINFTSLKIK